MKFSKIWNVVKKPIFFKWKKMEGNGREMEGNGRKWNNSRRVGKYFPRKYSNFCYSSSKKMLFKINLYLNLINRVFLELWKKVYLYYITMGWKCREQKSKNFRRSSKIFGHISHLEIWNKIAIPVPISPIVVFTYMLKLSIKLMKRLKKGVCRGC